MLMNRAPILPELITVAAAARALGRDPKTVAKWLRSPEAEGVVVVLGNRRYLRRAALVELIAGATPTPNTDAENDR
jgi:hypothetical protein